MYKSRGYLPTAQGHSAIDRATVSKTVGWGFESLCPCQYGPIAQLDRALDYESRCREFESLLGHQKNGTMVPFFFCHKTPNTVKRLSNEGLFAVIGIRKIS